MSDNWIPGQVAHLTNGIRDVGGTLVDPGALRLEVRPPGGTVTTYSYGAGEIIRESVGVYYCDVPLTVAGVWAFRWESDPPYAGAGEMQIQVIKSRLP